MTEEKIESSESDISLKLSQHEYWEEGGYTRKYDHPLVEFFAKQRIEFISKYIPINEIDDVLDVGSGRGFSSAYLPKNNSITATDFSLREIKQNPVQHKIVCTAEEIPYRDQSFSLVNEWELLHHLSDPIKAVKEMSRIASDYLILFEPNRQNPGQLCLAMFKKEERNLLHHHKKMMYKLVKDIDFNILACETVGWVFPNRMPEFIFPLAKKLPFKFPILGLSNVLICKRK
tara:strand:+ start:657 stop:1349 length:693 start_codon:yes stop_codon:yes gene_type:complete